MTDGLASGASPDEILADHDFLEVADIRASLQYASEQIDHAALIGLKRTSWRAQHV